MKTGDAFSTYHPLINFAYFLAVLLFAMFIMQPVCLLLTLICSLAYAAVLLNKRDLFRNLLLLLPLFLFTALLNPLFNHAGTTILAYLPNGNPLTLESIFYGLAAGSMLVAVICWFSCYNAVMTSDKFVWLFGRVIPALSLVLSMTLRFVPRFRRQLQGVRQARYTIDRKPEGIMPKIRQGLKVISIMITWALENSIDTADSMRSRGYGLPGRTAFSIYRWNKRDSFAGLFLLLTVAYVLIGKLKGALYWYYFPQLGGRCLDAYQLSVYLAYSLLLLLPLLIDLREFLKWRRLSQVSGDFNHAS